jgi:hypothetical protein
MGCPHERECSLFEQRAIEASLRVWRSYYCDGNFDRCERFRLAEAGHEVSPSLLPNGRMLELPLPNLTGAPLAS